MNMLITGIVCLVIGLIIGFYVLPLFSKEKQRDDKLENKLSSMQQDFSEYQQEVANHLRDTSSLIDKVHHHYLQLQEHLFQGAKSLNRDTAKSSLFEPSQYYMHVQKSINSVKTKLVRNMQKLLNKAYSTIVRGLSAGHGRMASIT